MLLIIKWVFIGGRDGEAFLHSPNSPGLQKTVSRSEILRFARVR